MKNKTIILLAICMPFSINVEARDTFNEYQLKRLFQPSAAQYAAEKRGKVYIYDGLSSAQVDEALSSQFDRIDHMMFTRVVYKDENGEEHVESDGCD